MNIYFVRHADAESISSSISDFNRKLTADGEQTLKIALRNWKKFIPPFDKIISSPYLRALQTAQIIAAAYGIYNSIQTDDRTASGGKSEDIIKIANSFEANDILFVGHEPDLSNNVSSLISADRVNLSFQKGTIAKVVFRDKAALAKGRLEFIIPLEAFTI